MKYMTTPLLRPRKSNRASIDLFAQVGQKFREGTRAKIALALVAHRDGTSFSFLAADDQHVGNLLELSVANFRLQLFVAIIEMRAEAGVLQSSGNFFRVFREFFAERQHFRLHGRQPHGKRSSIMFDQDAEESLDRAP